MPETLQILLVEDNENDELLVQRELLKGGLRTHLFRVMTADEMRDALQTKSWDLILSDFRLPQFSAIAALRLLKETGLDLPFIILSGTVSEETAVEVMRAGAHDFLPKGNLTRLCPAIEREIRESKSRASHRESQARLLGMEKLASLGTLAAGVAHEIATPLAYIRLNLEMVLQSMQSGVETADQIEDMLIKVREGVERVQEIASDLKSFARVRENKIEEVDLEACMESALKMVAHELRNRGMVQREYKAIPKVQAQPGRISQVFMNLLVNAAHAMPEGGPSNRLVVRLYPVEPKWVVAEIEDSGTGIPKENLRKIFEPFFTTKAQGTGLGLPLVQKLVEEAGGRLSLDSEVGRGTRVRIELPASEKVEEARPVAREGEAAFSRRGRILIVDDEPALAEVVGRYLSRWHDVTLAGSGKEALSHMQEGKFDLVLSDMMMPEMSGAQLYEIVKREQPGEEKKLAFVTGGAYTEESVRFLEEVANPRLEKPFRLNDLGRLVEDAISAKS